MTDLTKYLADGQGRPIRPVLFNTVKDGSGTWYFGLVDSSGRLVLGDGTAAIGKLAANSGVDIGDVNVLVDKTIETELQAIVAVAADAQKVSSTLALTNMKKIAVFIDHGRDATGAFVGGGTEYRVEVSEKATGNDTWRPIAAATAAITAALGHAMDAEEAAGQTVIEIGATTPVLGDIQFFKNGTIANSEWGRIIDKTNSVSFTLQDGLTNTQAAITTYSQGEHFAMLLDVSAYTRLRVVCNNNNGSTNQNIVWRCAAIDQT